MGVMDRYNERKKKREEEKKSNSLSTGGVAERYALKKYYSTFDTSSVNDEYINTFISDVNNFFKGTEETYNSIGWGNASSVYDSTNKTWQGLKTRQDTINAWLYKNRNNLTEESYKSLSDTMSSIDSGASSILGGFADAKKFYGQWETEDSYNKWKANEDWKAEMKSAEDFEEYSQKGAAIENPTYREAMGWMQIAGHPVGGDPVNNKVTFMQDEENYQAALLGNDTFVNANLHFMDKDEVAIYNYYLGKGDTEKAEAYLASLEDTLNQRMGGQLALNAQNANLEWVMAISTGLDQFASGVRNIDNFIMGTEADPISVGQYAGAAIRENIESDFWKGAWDLGVTISNQLPSILVGYVTGGIGGLATMGAGVLGNSYAEMRNLGYDEWQSRGYAALTTAAELALQYVIGGIDSLGGKYSLSKTAAKAINSVDNGLARFAISTGASMLSEGFEEAAQSVLEPIFKAIFTGEWEGIDWGEVAYSGLLGALSAGALEGIPSGIKTIAQNASAKSIYGNNAQDLINETIEITPEGNRALLWADKYQQKLDSGKNLSGQQLRNLVEANEQTLVDSDIAKIKAAAEERLTQLGETGDVSALADILVKQASGEKLTLFEKNKLKNSVYGQRVANEMSPENIQSGGYASNWAKEIGTERINAEEYSNLSPEYRSAVDKFSKNLTDEILDDDDEEGEKQGKIDPVKGKTTYAGEEVSIKDISSIKDGEVFVHLNNGEEVSVRDVEFSNEKEALIYEAVADMNIETARDLIEGFNQGNLGDGRTISFVNYLRGFNEAYRYGSVGMPVSEMSRSGFSIDLSEAQRQIAYNRGKADSMTKISSKQAGINAKVESAKNAQTTEASKKKGKVYFDKINKESLTERQKASVKALIAVAKALGVDIVLFESPVNAKGQHIGENGSYDPTTNTIRIDIHAGMNGEATMLFTAAHELTHFIREWSPAKFKIFADFLLEQYGEKGVSVERLIQNQIKKGEKNNRWEGKTEEEIYNIAYEEVIADSCEAMLTDSNAIEKLASLMAKDKSLFNKIKNFISKLVAKIKEVYAGLDPNSTEGRYVREMKDAAEKLQALWTDALIDAGQAYSAINDMVQIDTESQSVSPMFSERTWTESEYVQERDKTAKAIAKALNVSVDVAKAYIDDINSVARLIADDRARLDYEPNLDEKATVLKKNSDYKFSVDMSTLCAKRLLFTGTFDAIQRQLPNTAFDSDDIVRLRQMMVERGYEVACGICYVESTRREIGTITQDFINSYKEAQKTGKPITRVNSEGKTVELKKTKEQKETTVDKTTDKFFAEKDYTPTLADLNTTDIDLVKKEHPLVYEAYLNFMNARGQAKPKLLETRAEYKGEILKHFKTKSAVTARNNAGGLRLQSFSDFEVPHLIDMMQITMDMARVGLKAQAYTKVVNFAEAFGNTGIKINLSLIAKDSGLDSNGKLIFDDTEGINHKEAFRLREKFSKNVGTILVGKNDAHIVAAMADPRIDYIIPFHKSSWKESLYDALGLTGYADYTDTQNEKYLDPNRGKAKNFDPSEYWDYSKTGDENAQIYLEKCREDGRIPKFPQFQGYEGYWKLLIDFKMYDNDGVGSPQEVVRPIFDDATNKKILDEYKGGHRSYPEAKDVVSDFVKEYKSEKKYSDREVTPISDADYKTAEKFFGTTTNYNVAGYILKDGKMLDFSGQHEGNPDPTYRTVDHRDIWRAWGEKKTKGSNTDELINTISNGNIRLMPETGGINLAVMPTAEQMNVLRGYINHFRGEIIIDVDAVGGDTIHSWEYNRGTSSAKILSDIKAYFEKGTIPQKQSSLNQFRYSDRVLMGSLFSGGGTLEAGLVYQMLDKEFAVEYNKQIASVYTDNHGKEHMFVGDVQNFNSKDKQNVFYLHASPVCKNFSPASHSGGETTLDITTAKATARVLEEQMPQVFTVENVKRYIGSEAYNLITNKLNELGYTWDVDVYKASDYGNATKRERMIIRAVKDGLLPAKPQKASKITCWGEATKDLWKTDLIPSTLVKSKIEAIKNTPELKNIMLTKLDKPLMIYDTTKSKKITYAWADELAPTLTTKCGDARIIMPDGKVYAPTPKFMGRIQGLPDNYKYPKANTNAFKIIGNGIPTQLTKAVMGGVLDSAYQQTHDGKVLYSDRDSEGNTLSKEQQEFFKNSKVRWDDKLMPVYHGTRDEFTVFDSSMAHEIHREGGLLWAAKDYEYAKLYSFSDAPIVKKGYLNITNLLDIGDIDMYADYNERLQELADIVKLSPSELEAMVSFRNPVIYDITSSKAFRDRIVELGYDGVTALESGLPTYGFVNSNQFKNADNKAPTTNPDIRYSNRESDQAYLDAVERGDIETAREMVYEAADKALSKSKITMRGLSSFGKGENVLVIVYHATPAKFTVFDKAKIGSGNGGANFGKGFYFSTSRSYVQEYDSNIGEYFLDIRNPFDYHTLDKAYIVDMLEKSGYEYDKDFVESYDEENLWDDDLIDNFLGEALMGKNPYNEFSKMLQNAGFDGIIVDGGDEIIAFDSNQIKSADPVTYDDNGNVIPLSERFNSKNNDIRYSDRDTVEQKITSAKTSIKQIPALFKDKNVVFGKTNIDIGGGRFDLATNYLAEKGTKNYVFDPYNRSEAENTATLAFLQSGKRADTATCANVLNVIAEEGARANVILETAKAIKADGTAYFMVYEGDSSGVGRETSSGWQNNRKTADYVGEISKYFESVERKGKLIIARNPVNNLPKATWEVAIGKGIKYSDRDPDSVSNRSLLANALETAVQNDIERNKLQQYKEKIDLINSEEAKLHDLNKQIHDMLFTKGARDNAKLRDLQFESKQTANRINTYDRQLLDLEASKPLKDVLEREKKLAYKRAEQKGKEALSAYREKMAQTTRELLSRASQQRREAVSKVRESHDKREAKNRLQKLVLETAKWVSYPTKDDVKCPDILRKPYADFLQSIDLSSKRSLEGGDATYNDIKIAMAMDSLATAVEKIRTAQDPAVDTDTIVDSGFLDLPAYFVEKIRDIAEGIKVLADGSDFVVNRMSAQAIRELCKVITQLNASIKNMGRLNNNLRFSMVEELGDHSMTFMDSMGETKHTNAVSDFVKWDNALPYYAFKRFGEGGESIFEELMDAQDNLAFNAQRIFDFKEKNWTDKEANAWGKDTHTIELTEGKKVTLTSSQAMGIYCLSRREQAVPHLLGGGIRVIGSKKGAKSESDSHTTLSEADIGIIVKSLTERQKKVAEAIQEFMSTVCADWGNEISMKRFLTNEFTEPFYYPIESNDENLSQKDPKAQQSDLYRLLNISATKPTIKGANNEVIIRNIFDVFTNHSSDMARLNAYGMAILDYMKWINYREKIVKADGVSFEVKSVVKSMRTAYGDKAKSYVINLIKDINGRSSDGGDHPWLMKMTRMAKTASVGFNLRVAMLQVTAYPRAAMVLSAGSLAKGLTKIPNIKKAKKYCGIALWKSFGFYDTNIARSIEDQIKGTKGIRQKLIELSLKGAEWADAITWGALWNACEYEVAKTTKNKVGSEEFNQEVGKKLREVVYATQVVDSTLTRTQVMRNKSGLTQTATAFMSEASLTTNILMNAGFEFQKEKRISGSAKTAWKKTGKLIGKTIGVYSSVALLTALIESLADAYRDDDDEEFAEKFGEAFTENAISNIVPFNKIPIISDIADLILAQFDIGYFSSDRLDTTWLTQANNALKAWKDVLGEEDSSTTVYNALYKTVRAFSSMTGVAWNGLMREIVTLWNNTAGVADPTLKISNYDRTNEELGNLLYEAILNGEYDKEQSIRGQFDDEDDIDSALKKALRTNDPRIREAAQAYYEGDIGTYDAIAREIIGEGNFDEAIVKGAIKSEVSAIKREQEEANGTTEESSEAEDDEVVSIYVANDINTAFNNGDTALAKEIIQDLIDTKVANGMEEKNAKSSLRSSMTSYWKPLYKEAYANGDTQEMYRIRLILLESGLYGGANDVVKTAQNWLKD